MGKDYGNVVGDGQYGAIGFIDLSLLCFCFFFFCTFCISTIYVLFKEAFITKKQFKKKTKKKKLLIYISQHFVLLYFDLIIFQFYVFMDPIEFIAKFLYFSYWTYFLL